MISREYVLKGIQLSSVDFKDIDISYLENDANCDGETNMADAVMIMQTLANPDKNHISTQGRFNADLDNNGLTNADALEIQ